MKFLMSVKGTTQVVDVVQGVGEKMKNPPVDLWELTMLRSAQKNFIEQGRPEKWWPLSLRTIARRKNKNKGSILILRDTGMLMQSLDPKGQGLGGVYAIRNKARLSVSIGTNRPGASAHQVGDPNRGLPRRIILKHQPEDVEDYKQIYVDHMMGVII